MRLRGSSVVALIFAASLGRATVLPPTGSAPVAPSPFNTPVNGPFLATTRLQPFSATNSLGQTTIAGHYAAMVYSDPSNSFCTGCLDFFVVVESSSASLDAIERITLASFGSFLTNVGYSNGAGSLLTGIDPDTVDRSSNGSVIGFNFSVPAGVAPGQDTQVLEIQTNATQFVNGTLQIIDSSVASVAAFAPACVVPEASSISLTLIGGAFLCLGFIRRRHTTK